jgi:diguanylate cyclase (GGDEF)-like protein
MSPTPPTPRPKILIVDDTAANRVALRRLLRDVGAQLVEAEGGNQALAEALRLEDELALVLLDVQMPEMDGYEVAELLLGEENTQNVPIIFLTAAYRDAEHRFRGYDRGAVDYIEKPLDESILLAKVTVFLQLWQQRQELQGVVEQLAEKNLELQAQTARSRDAEQRLHHLSSHDALTQLPNRNLLEEACRMACARAKRNSTRAAILFCDLDRFKPINDELGHEAGDRILTELSMRLLEHLRDMDTLVRFGGDEFVVLMADLHHPSQAADVAQRLIAATVEPFELNERQLVVGMSIGIALYPDHGASQQDLIREADQAMYRAKNQGGNGYRFADGAAVAINSPAQETP